MSRRGSCPSCGAPLTFEVGSSRSAVCRFCNTLVARHGQDLDAVGKVADLTPTGSRIELGAAGSYLGEAFTVVGRLQLEWTQGVWDEWYLSFPNQRWGWLAEAQGRYYVTFPIEQPGLPEAERLRPGELIQLGSRGRFVVTDIKRARFAGAAGELPDEVSPDDLAHTVDLEGAGGVFATLDYSDGGPKLYLGRQVPLGELGLRTGVGAEPLAELVDGEALVCEQCGAPIVVRVPGQTVRLVCGSCNALLDASQGAARLVEVLDRHREEPLIPIGKRGTLRGVELMVVGSVVRGCDVDHVHYTWEELLLYDPKTTSLSWLVCSEGHWSLARAISAADVEAGFEARCRGKRFRRYSSVMAFVERVLGELPWAVTVGEMAHVEEYTAPPEGLSVERNGDEVNWSHVEHLEPSEVARAFGIEPPPRLRVGAFQPWPFASALRELAPWIAGGAAVVLLLAMVLSARSQSKYVSHTFGLDDVAAEASEGQSPGGRKTYTFLSQPFELTGRDALEVRLDASVQNAWVGVEGGLIREDTGDVTLFSVEAAYYSGYQDGESWSEGSRSASQDLSSPSRGSYVLRADLEWDPMLAAPPPVSLELRTAGLSGYQILLALAVLLSPLLVLFHRGSFEKQRWEDSNITG